MVVSDYYNSKHKLEDRRIIKMAQDTEKLLLKPAEVFRSIGVSRAKGYAMLAAGELPIVRMGKSIRVPVGALRQWVEERTRWNRPADLKSA